MRGRRFCHAGLDPASTVASQFVARSQYRSAAMSELELRLHVVQPSHAELPEPQHVLDPAVGRLGNPLALAIGAAALIGLKLGRHGQGAWVLARVDFDLRLALASQCHHQRWDDL
jgi:hypothetical protein